MKPVWIALVALAAGCASIATVAAQSFPAHKVTITAPFPPGGPSDATARVIQPELERIFKQTVIVENVPGASGSVGVQKFLDQPADGHALLLGTADNTVLAPLSVASARYDGSSVRLVTLLNRSYFILATRPGLKAGSVADLVALAKAPGSKGLTFASWGIGSMPHLIGEDFRLRTGASMLHVPYRGMAPMVVDLMGETVDIAFLPLAGNVPELLASNQIKALAVTSAQRLDTLKAVPTLTETGTAGNFEYSSWPGVFVSPKTPDAVAGTINAAVAEVMKGAAFRKFVVESGSVIAEPMSLAEAATFYKAEIDKFQGIAKQIQLQKQ